MASCRLAGISAEGCYVVAPHAAGMLAEGLFMFCAGICSLLAGAMFPAQGTAAQYLRDCYV
jgi:hypothetical protein